MKKSELRFKCVLGSEKRNKQMYDAIMQAGIKNHIKEEDFVKTAMCLRIDDTWNNEVSPTYAGKITKSYEDSTIPEVTFETALEMLASIEPDAPEFDIKLREEVLVSDVDSDIWELCEFARVHTDCFMMIGYGYGQKMIRYAGNERFHGTADTPDGWLECENSKPVRRTK
jgi:hypothetical protein